jgi:hypothetical protein
VEGTVTDQTPTGRRNVNNVLEFALKDTPAISDNDMQSWMQYKFMGQAFPADAKGVEVTVSVLDPNGNYYEVGKTTSDVNGFYSMTFEPEVPGKYTVFAKFDGSKSYYGSHGVSAVNVEEIMSSTSAESTPQPQATFADMYFMPVSIGMFALIIVVLALLLLSLLRKR